MKLTYKVTAEQYRDVIANRMRAANLKSGPLFITIALCAVPLIVLLFCAVSGTLANLELLLLSVLAICLSIVNLLFRTCYRFRAQRELERMISKSIVKKGFFALHTAEVTPKGLIISYPGFHQQYDWVDYAGAFDQKDAMFLVFAGQIADIIPFSAFQGGHTKDAFIDLICQNVRAALVSANRSERENVPKDPLCVVRYAYTLETYIQHQRISRRKAAITPQLWKPAQIIMVTLLAILIYSLTLSSSPAILLLKVLGILFILAPYILVYSPMINAYIRHQLANVLMYKPKHETVLYLTNDAIKIIGDIHCLDFKRSDILYACELPGCVAIYFSSGAPLTVPVRDDIINSVFFAKAVTKPFREGNNRRQKNIFGH